MNRSASVAQSPLPAPARARVVLHRLVAIAGLGIAAWGVSAQHEVGALPPDLRVDAARITAVDGERVDPDADHAADHAEFLVERRAPGDVARVVTGGEASIVTLVDEVPTAAWITTLVSALVYLGICGLVFGPRTAHPETRDFFWCTLLAGLAIAIGGVYPPRGPAAVALPVIHIASLALLPAFFVRLALSFPTASPVLARRRAAMPSLFLAAAAIAAWQIARWMPCLDHPDAAAWEATRPPVQAGTVLLVAGMAAGCGILFVRGRRAERDVERRQARWILWGIAIGATPFVFLRALPRLFHAESPVSPVVDRVVELVVPISFGIAVVRDKLFDIDVIIRRSVIYTAVAAVLAAVALTLGPLGASLVERVAPGASTSRDAIWAVSGIVAGLLFVPLRRAVARAVDRTFFQIRYRHEQALAGLETTLASAHAAPAVVHVLRDFVDATWAPSIVGVVAVTPSGLVGAGPIDADVARAALDACATDAPQAVAAADATGVAELETPAFPSAARAAGLVLVQPIAREGRRLGAFLLGEKASGRRYVEEDLALLRAAARQGAVALERAELAAKAAEEEMARRALVEEDRMKADFLLRVAHDLRTPLTAVRWSVDNLRDGVLGPVNASQAETLAAVEASTAQLLSLVTNLLDLGRVGLAATRGDVGPVDLARLAREVAASLKPVGTGKGVSIAVRADDPQPPVAGRRDELVRVVANLVDNALKYAPPGTAVEVEVGEGPAGTRRLTVRDHGPGLPAQGRERLFELFRQGPASPHSNAHGFGVGLYIVRSWVEGLHGRVFADDAPGGGARFVCDLPTFATSETTT